MEVAGGLRSRLAAVRLLALDVDGTVLNSRHRVSTATRAAITDALECGIQIVLASSRGPAALGTVLADLPSLASKPFIASQGGLIGRFGLAGELDVRRHTPAPLDAARAVVKAAVRRGISVSWYTESTWFVSSVDAHVKREAAITRTVPTVADLVALSAPPSKLMLIAPAANILSLEQLAQAVPASLQAQFSNPNYLEITARGVDKGSALRAHMADRGIKREQAAAIGDGLNDLAMFEAVGIRVAPANARPTVLERANVQVRSNDEDGPAALMQQLVALRAEER